MITFLDTKGFLKLRNEHHKFFTFFLPNLVFIQSLLEILFHEWKVIALNLISGVVIIITVNLLMAIEYILSQPVEVSSNLSSNEVGILLFGLIDIFFSVKLGKSFILHNCLEYTVHDALDALNLPNFIIQGLRFFIVLVVNHQRSPVRHFLDYLFELGHLYSFWFYQTRFQASWKDEIEIFLGKFQSLVVFFYFFCIQLLILKNFFEYLIKLQILGKILCFWKSMIYFLIVFIFLMKEIHYFRNRALAHFV